ncbi:MAG: hypothetical protein FWC92_04525 [Defluviitaleaceae bacterium]|nr:hypothetical protein [Defluviitaleaceae bacterium]
MGRGGRGGGGLRGGSGRMGGGGLSRGGSVRGLGSSGLGGAGRGGRGAIPTPGRSAGLGSVGRGAPRAPVPRAPVARPMSRAGSFGAGVGVGMGMGMMGGGRRRRGWGWGGGWGWGRRRRMMPMGGHMMGGPMMGGPVRRSGGGCGGCMTVILMIVLVMLVISVVSYMGNFATPQNWGQQAADPFPGVIPSTIIRTPLPAGSAIETGSLFTDHLNWIGNQSQLVVGMRNFHQATGVRPHLYIVGEIYGTQNPTDAQILSFAQGRYDALFNDEAHVLLLFFENEAQLYGMAVVPGNQARSVIDQEAEDILLDFVQRYYYMDISEEELFSRAFNSAAERIMHVPPEPPNNRAIWLTVIIVAGVLLLTLLLFRWWQRKQEQKNLEAEQTERILSQPLESMGSDAATQLAQQYEDDNNNENN